MSPPNNPYIAGSPIKGQQMFFGRDDIFEKVRAHLVGEHQDNPIVMYGQRRTGKTSVLYQMGRRLNEYAGEERYVAVLVDLQGFALKSMDHFLLELAYAIRRELPRDYKIPRPDKAVFKTDARDRFRNSFLPTVQTALGTRRLLLMFDEAICLQEAVAQNKLEKEVFAYLRSIMQHEGNISFIFSLGSKVESLLPEYILMLNVVSTLHVSFLDDRAARSLVTEPVAGLYTFDEEAIERLLALTSCHPYFTQVICHTLFTRWLLQGLTQVTVTDIDAVLDEATNLTVVNLKYIWDEATPVEKFVLAAMAEMEADKVNALALDRHLKQADIYLPSREITEALKELNQREVIDLPSQPHFYVILLPHWLIREKPLTLVRDQLREDVPELPIAVQKTRQGDQHRIQDEEDLALRAYTEALNNDPNYVPALLGQGEILLARQNWSQAIQRFAKISSLEPDHSKAHKRLVQARLAQAKQILDEGKENKAKSEYEAVLALEPEDVEATRALKRLSIPLWRRNLAYQWQQLNKRPQLILGGIGMVALVVLLFFTLYNPPNLNMPSLEDEQRGIWQRPIDEMTMVYVPAGPFIMGSTLSQIEDALQLCHESNVPGCEKSWFDDEQPQHEVFLDAFWIDKTEVSNQQYDRCVQSGICTSRKWADDPNWNGPNNPVVAIDWQNARAYCQWAGGDLPTEAQWEKTARGTDGRIYPWGNEFDGTKLNFCDINCQNDWRDKAYDDGYEFVAPVNSFPVGASPYGVLNMAGNVAEWTLDWFSDSYYAESDNYYNPSGPNNGSLRVVRGGSSRQAKLNSRTMDRYTSNPNGTPSNFGFRCVFSTLSQ